MNQFTESNGHGITCIYEISIKNKSHLTYNQHNIQILVPIGPSNDNNLRLSLILERPESL